MPGYTVKYCAIIVWLKVIIEDGLFWFRRALDRRRPSDFFYIKIYAARRFRAGGGGGGWLSSTAMDVSPSLIVDVPESEGPAIWEKDRPSLRLQSSHSQHPWPEAEEAPFICGDVICYLRKTSIFNIISSSSAFSQRHCAKAPRPEAVTRCGPVKCKSYSRLTIVIGMMSGMTHCRYTKR